MLGISCISHCRERGVSYQRKYHEKLHSVSVSSTLRDELQVCLSVCLAGCLAVCLPAECFCFNIETGRPNGLV